MEKQHGLKIFDSKAFLDSIHEDDYEFIKQMINTQLFTSFIDKAFRVQNNLLQGEEKDSEKIRFFLKWLNILHYNSYKQLREYLENNLVEAIKDYYNKEIIAIEDFKEKYIQKLNSNFEDGMNPKIYLIQDSVVNSDAQLSLISKINEKLIIQDINPPLEFSAKVEPSINTK